MSWLLKPLVLSILFFINLNSAWATSPQPFALVRASYAEVNSQDVRGGFIGTAFFVGPKTAITAFHVVNPQTFTPLPDHKIVKLWMADTLGHYFPVKLSQVKGFPSLDISVIQFDQEVASPAMIYTLAQPDQWNRNTIQAVGFKEGSVSPSLRWINDNLEMVAIKTPGFHLESGSVVRSPLVTVKAQDVNLENIQCLNLSFGSFTGMSGGPTLSEGKVVGINSFGFPANAKRKTSAWSVYLTEEYRKQIFKQL